MTALAEARAARRLIARARADLALIRALAEAQAVAERDMVHRLDWLRFAARLGALEVQLAGPLTEPTEEQTNGR